MTDNEILKNKCINVKMREIKISTEDKPVIGTQSLGPCMAFILYSKENKRAIVGHVSNLQLTTNSGLHSMLLQIIKLIVENGLFRASFDLMLIEGGQKSEEFIEDNHLEILKDLEKKTYSLFEILEINLKRLKAINITSINKNTFSIDDVQTVDLSGRICSNQNPEASKRFAFNANTGKFLTSEVFANEEALEFEQGTHHI